MMRVDASSRSDAVTAVAELDMDDLPFIDERFWVAKAAHFRAHLMAQFTGGKSTVAFITTHLLSSASTPAAQPFGMLARVYGGSAKQRLICWRQQTHALES